MDTCELLALYYLFANEIDNSESVLHQLNISLSTINQKINNLYSSVFHMVEQTKLKLLDKTPIYNTINQLTSISEHSEPNPHYIIHINNTLERLKLILIDYDTINFNIINDSEQQINKLEIDIKTYKTKLNAYTINTQQLTTKINDTKNSMKDIQLQLNIHNIDIPIDIQYCNIQTKTIYYANTCRNFIIKQLYIKNQYPDHYLNNFTSHNVTYEGISNCIKTYNPFMLVELAHIIHFDNLWTKARNLLSYTESNYRFQHKLFTQYKLIKYRHSAIFVLSDCYDINGNMKTHPDFGSGINGHLRFYYHIYVSDFNAISNLPKDPLKPKYNEFNLNITNLNNFIKYQSFDY